MKIEGRILWLVSELMSPKGKARFVLCILISYVFSAIFIVLLASFLQYGFAPTALPSKAEN